MDNDVENAEEQFDKILDKFNFTRSPKGYTKERTDATNLTKGQLRVRRLSLIRCGGDMLFLHPRLGGLL